MSPVLEDFTVYRWQVWELGEEINTSTFQATQWILIGYE